MKRREASTALALGLGGAMLRSAAVAMPGIGTVMAQPRRTLELQLLGFALGIHVPATAAFMSILPTMPGYAEPKTARLSEIRIATQTMIGGSADIGESDPPTVLSAAEAGAQFKIVGKPYDSTSLVFVVNGDRVKSIADLAKPETRVAIGARGDITHVILAAPLLKRGIGIDKMTLLELPGSGTRLSALLSGKIDAGSLHFDQAETILGKGNFRILIEPWKEVSGWTNEVWVVRTEWLRKPENERALTDFLKANVIAFRRANTDFDWYLEGFRKYVTLKDADKMTAVALRPIWEKLRSEIRAWPADGNFSVAAIQAMLPACKAADAIRGTVKVEDVVETRYLQQALKELG
jgi:NitT/TauT family transport system substrate-binding protein